jgi:hypothetical protein
VRASADHVGVSSATDSIDNKISSTVYDQSPAAQVLAYNQRQAAGGPADAGLARTCTTPGIPEFRRRITARLKATEGHVIAGRTNAPVIASVV